jgi:exosortase D (VPLPA-CTERM-specific)
MTRVFRTGRWHYVLAAAAVVALLLMFRGTFSYLAQQWQREEYSHGWMIPLLAAFLVWQRRREIESVAFTGSWSGVALVLAGMALYFIGALASITTIDAYALVIVIIGAALAWLGWRAFALVRVPLLLLFLMNPIPNFFYANLSSTLQLWSSRIGVGVIRLFGISVFLEGNVIDLGNYQLQVAEACSGLRYLFPLMTLGVIIGYLFRGQMWMRWLIVLSAAPITVLMNSFRIGVIGVLVDLYGTAQAEGFLHLFEGWVVFMLCFLLLLLECWILARLGGMRAGLRELFALEFPGPRPPNAVATIRALTAPLPVAVILLLLVAWPAYALPSRPEQRRRAPNSASSGADWHLERAAPGARADLPRYAAARRLRPRGLQRDGAGRGGLRRHQPVRGLLRLAAWWPLGTLAALLPAWRRLADRNIRAP